MPSQPFITEFSVDNYRVLKHFSVKGLRRINLFGGLNGSGKSTLLEAIFTFIDQGGAIPVLRPFIFRSVPASLNSAQRVIVGDGNEFTLTAKTRLGELGLNVKWEPQYIGSTITIEIPKEADQGSSIQSSTGITMTGSRDGQISWKRHFADANQGLALMEEIQYSLILPPAVCLTRYTTHIPGDLAGRFSKALTSGHKKDLIKTISEVVDGVEDLMIVNINDQSIVHAQFKDNTFIPVSFIGDGALTILSIAVAIMESKGGCVLLDEFDAAVHYSKLENIWRTIHALAVKYDCQIFAATHSIESIKSLISAMISSNKQDISYIRLDRVDENILSTRYSYEDLANSVDQHWDVR